MASGGRREKSSLNPDPDFMRVRLKNARYFQSLPKVDTSDPQAVRERIRLYFDKCMEAGIRPGVEGLCTALHIDRGTFLRWASGVRRAGSEQQAIAVEAKQILADLMEQYMMDGEINPIAGIFLSSNNFGYDRNATLTVQTQNAVASADDPDRIAQKYAADAIDVDANPAPLKIEGSEK